MTNRATMHRARLAIATLLLTVLVTLGWSSAASAHTEFDASLPADGATIDGPLSSVTIEFTNPAVESGDGFQLLEPDGTVRTPDAVDSTDGTSFVASFAPALEAGTYGFRWEVQAGDAHPINGSFQFTVDVAATVTTTATTTSTPSTEAPPSSNPAAATPASSPPTTVAAGDPVTSLDEFLATDTTQDPFVGRAARTMSISATVFSGGIIAALLWVIRGRREEIERLLVWVRLAGLGLVAGGFTALAALDEAQPSEGLVDVATTTAGVAALMTIVAGVLISVGFGARAGRIAATPRPLSAAVAVDEITSSRHHDLEPESVADREQLRWVPDASAIVGLAGIGVALGSYWFDGHTVSRGPWAVHAAVNLVHVTAASVWVGGVFALALVAAMRKRRRREVRLSAMVVRFSTIAAISLAALAAAGVIMAWLVLASPGELFTSAWGRVLLVKVTLVTIAAGLGGYNHFVLRPALEAQPDDPDLNAHLRRSLLVESAAMIAVIIATAVLVASSTS